MDYQVNEKVWVSYLDRWMHGIVSKIGNKRIKVQNQGRGVEGWYAPHNIKKLDELN
jgi:hypothetical protein